MFSERKQLLRDAGRILQHCLINDGDMMFFQIWMVREEGMEFSCKKSGAAVEIL